MSKSILHKIHSLLLIAALAFGQVGAGFLHNKHDAHETIIDLDQTVLVAHGEHCKVCSIDWVHQFIDDAFVFTDVRLEHITPEVDGHSSLVSSFDSLASDRAPPVTA